MLKQVKQIQAHLLHHFNTNSDSSRTKMQIETIFYSDIIISDRDITYEKL